MLQFCLTEWSAPMLRARLTAYSQGVCSFPLIICGCRSCTVVMMKLLDSSAGALGGSLSAAALCTFLVALSAAGNGLQACVRGGAE